MTTDKLAKYSTFDDSDVDEVDANVDALSPSVFMDLKEGDNWVRILPAPAGAWKTFRTFAVHYIDPIPGVTQNKTVFDCPMYELKQPCPVCNEAQRLMNSKNPVDKQAAKDLLPRSVVRCNVLNRNNPTAGAKVLGMGLTIWRQIKALRKNKRSGGDMTLPGEDGFDTIITRVGTGRFDTEYTVTLDRKNSAIAEDMDEMEEILSKQHNLDTLADATVPVELLKAFRSVVRAGHEPAARPAPQRPAVGKTIVEEPAESRSAVVDGKVAYDEDDPSTW